MSLEYFQFLKWRIKYPSFMKTFNSWIPTNRIPYFDPSMTNWFLALHNNIKDPQNLLSPCPICNAKMVVAWNTYFAIIHLRFHSGLNSWPQSSQTSEINTHGHRSCCAGPTEQIANNVVPPWKWIFGESKLDHRFSSSFAISVGRSLSPLKRDKVTNH